MKKYSVFKFLGFAVLFYLIYQSAAFLILDFDITNDRNPPEVKLSEIINISEERVKYRLNNYIKKDFVGFNAVIDKKYYLTTTKLGKTFLNYKILYSDQKLSKDAKFNFFAPSDIEDKSGRYIDVNSFPFKITKIYYYLEKGHIYKVNDLKFYEIEANFALFNISVGDENNRDFGYGGYQGKQSISFIAYKGDLYVLNLIPIGTNPYKSLHSLSERH